jgi:hypothetical protein
MATSRANRPAAQVDRLAFPADQLTCPGCHSPLPFLRSITRQPVSARAGVLQLPVPTIAESAIEGFLLVKLTIRAR